MARHSSIFTAIILGTVSCMLIGCLPGDDKPVAQESDTKTIVPESDSEPIETKIDSELVRDLQVLRNTVTLPGKTPVKASSEEACHAAWRVFEGIDFVGMSKDEVIALLGDPATISDYGIVAKVGRDEPLVYRFDSGFGGNDYRVEFKDGCVTNVQRHGLY